MYSVISKPKRQSMNSGLLQDIMDLLQNWLSMTIAPAAGGSGRAVYGTQAREKQQ
jgi:hypothetical protein